MDHMTAHALPDTPASEVELFGQQFTSRNPPLALPTEPRSELMVGPGAGASTNAPATMHAAARVRDTIMAAS